MNINRFYKLYMPWSCISGLWRDPDTGKVFDVNVLPPPVWVKSQATNAWSRPCHIYSHGRKGLDSLVK